MADHRHEQSQEPLSDSRQPKLKKRRLHGACDACRKKKVKCDSANMPGNICTNCTMTNMTCTHDIPRQPKKKETQQLYIQSLESRLEKLEQFLQTVHPEKDLEHIIGDSTQDEDDSGPEVAAASTKVYPDIRVPPISSNPNVSIKPVSPPPQTPVDPLSPPPEDDSEEADDLAFLKLSEYMGSMTLETREERFFGQSSVFMFASTALSMRAQLLGKDTALDTSRFRRPLYWEMRPWEMEFSGVKAPPFIYPEPDLLANLVDLFFEKVHIYYPCLHQPTFMKLLNDGVHHTDYAYGMTVLVVCALGSRYSSDPRVLDPGDTIGLSSGWKFFIQVPFHRNTLFHRSILYDLQYFALATIYLLGTSIPHAAWHMIGAGIRYALERGAHRRRNLGQRPTAEYELQKRCFWCMVCLERMMSAFHGRPIALQDEDMDAEYPIECDDEYWYTDDPADAFKQPPGKPSKLTAFVCHIKLFEMLAFTVRTLYSTRKSKLLSGMIGHEWEQRIVSELDSAMNNWKDTLPKFLRWNPEAPNSDFFHQSALLHTTFCFCEIWIHRPFTLKQSPLTKTSFAMCTNAARQCSSILEAAMSRGIRVFPNYIMTCFASTIVLFLSAWGKSRPGRQDELNKEMAIIQRNIAFLKECEKRWHTAGRTCDLLSALGSLTEYQKSSTVKRRRADSLTATGDATPKPAQATPAVPTPQAAVYNLNHTLPQPQQPQQQAYPTVQQPIPETASMMPSTDWDLSNLLLVQMGYVQPGEEEGIQQYHHNYGNQMHRGEQNPAYGSSWTDMHHNGNYTMPNTYANMGSRGHAPYAGPSTSDGYGHHQGGQYTSHGTHAPAHAPHSNDKMDEVWQNIPTNLDMEEWDAYLSSMGTS